MLFNSYVFLLLFLPMTLLLFYGTASRDKSSALIVLVLASLLFYAWWQPKYVLIIIGSIAANHLIGTAISKTKSRMLLVMGITLNVAIIGYYKYANFIVDNVNFAFDSSLTLERIILPLAISFFTFQQIAYLVDSYRGETKQYSFLQYCLFVTFFPQLIAGPIVKHQEMLPQFTSDDFGRFKHSHLAIGLTLFFLGLSKKVLLADTIAEYATPVFQAAEGGLSMTMFEAWAGALAYTFQLYFDFSGYSEMALGLGRMFGFKLPVNFFSPYKADSIIDFWRRWHITLSRFLRDYLYIPLGGNKKGASRKLLNIFITMFLGGIWHGAGWTFILWGLFHGTMLIINHSWRSFKRAAGLVLTGPTAPFFHAISMMTTFTAVCLAWVMFRAESIHGAIHLYKTMFGLNGISLPSLLKMPLQSYPTICSTFGITFDGMFHTDTFGQGTPLTGLLLLIGMMILTLCSPNTIQFLQNEKPVLDADSFTKTNIRWLPWRPSLTHLAYTTVLAVISIMYIQKDSPFLYFQF